MTDSKRIPHDGGPCPVPLGTLVYVEFEDSYVERAGRDAPHGPSEARHWADESGDPSADLWQIRDGESGIVAYRIAS